MAVADQIYEYCAEWASANRPATAVDWTPNENSASLLYTAQQGGRLKELVEDAKLLLQEADYHTGTEEDLEVGRPSSVHDMVIVDTAIQRCRQGDPILPRVLAVPEKGWKCRVLSIYPAFALVPGDILLRQMLPALKSEEFLDYDRVPANEKFQRFIDRSVDRSGTVVSSDLSNATDYLPHVYAQAVWHGILDAWHAPEWVYNYVNTILGPTDLKYPDGKIVRTKRGIPMGTPLSFPTLCLLHKFAVDRSGNRHSPHLIRGDDFIGVLDNPDLYFSEMESLGFRINRVKTLISPDGGVFAESTVRFRTKEVPTWAPGIYRSVVTKGWKLSDIPLAGLLHLDVTGGRSAIRRVGAVYENCHLSRKQSKIFHRAARLAWRTSYQLCLSKRLPLFARLNWAEVDGRIRTGNMCFRRQASVIDLESDMHVRITIRHFRSRLPVSTE